MNPATLRHVRATRARPSACRRWWWPAARLGALVLGALVLGTLLTGCTGSALPAPATGTPVPVSAQTEHAVPGTHAPTASTNTIADAAGEHWRIDANSSFLRLRVFRGGTLARLGHNHVIVAPLAGTARTRASQVDLLEASTELARWRIDDAQERIRAGAGFESVPDAAAIAGTRTNLFSKALLDAEQFPAIAIRGHGGPLADGDLPLTMEVEVQGRRVPLELVLRATRTGASWHAEGTTGLTHAQLGLTPFSALGGALKVEERIEVDVQVELAPVE